VVVTQSEIGAVRRVVELPVEMLQLCSSASSCMWMHVFMEEHLAGREHSSPFLSVSQYSSNIVVPCSMNSTISTPFLSKKTVTISFLADNVF
jgi:hypothetical protein